MAIRAINDGSTATTNIVVNGVNIGDADAGYPTFADALAAASAGDKLVWTGPQILIGTFTISVDQLEITVADNVRYTTHDFSTGVRISSTTGTVFTFNQAGAQGTYIRNLVLEATVAGGDTVLNTGTNTVVLEACLLKNRDGGAAVRSSDGPVAVNHCFIEIGDGSRGVVKPDTADSSARARNTVVLAAHDDALAAFEGGATLGREVYVGNCYAGDASGVTTAAARYTNCAESVNVVEDGYNASSANDAPGTVTYQSLDASDLFVDTTIGSYDLDWKNLLDSRVYVGGESNFSGTYVDLNNDVRSTDAPWFIGAVTPYLYGDGAGLTHYAEGILPSGEDFEDLSDDAVRNFLLEWFQPDPLWTVSIPFGGWLVPGQANPQPWESNYEGFVPSVEGTVPEVHADIQQVTDEYIEFFKPDPVGTVTIPFGGWLNPGVPITPFTVAYWEGGEIDPTIINPIFENAEEERHLVELYPPAFGSPSSYPIVGNDIVGSLLVGTRSSKIVR